jgi:hypothetical protein
MTWLSIECTDQGRLMVSSEIEIPKQSTIRVVQSCQVATFGSCSGSRMCRRVQLLPATTTNTITVFL